MTTDDQKKKLPNRRSLFWERAFLRSYQHVLSQLTGKDDPPLPHHAVLATRMADQCVRARDDFGSAVCPDCIGVGCGTCQWTGKADHLRLNLGDPVAERPDLRVVPGAAVEAITELDSEPPPPLTGR